VATINVAELSPLPSTLPDALQEIVRLRLQLILTNQKWEKAVSKAELDRRAASGIIALLKRQILALRATGSAATAGELINKLLAHFQAHKQGWFTKEDVAIELKSFFGEE
jgi:hypothetical protein